MRAELWEEDREPEAKHDSQAIRAWASLTRAHPTLPEQGDLGWYRDNSQAQAKAQVIRKVHSDEADASSSWEVSPCMGQGPDQQGP